MVWKKFIGWKNISIFLRKTELDLGLKNIANLSFRCTTLTVKITNIVFSKSLVDQHAPWVNLDRLPFFEVFKVRDNTVNMFLEILYWHLLEFSSIFSHFQRYSSLLLKWSRKNSICFPISKNVQILLFSSKKIL